MEEYYKIKNIPGKQEEINNLKKNMGKLKEFDMLYKGHTSVFQLKDSEISDTKEVEKTWKEFVANLGDKATVEKITKKEYDELKMFLTVTGFV